MPALFRAALQTERGQCSRYPTRHLAACLYLAAAGLALCLSPAEAAEHLSEAPAAPAPELILPDLSGKTIDLETLRGKVVLVSFWASWCSPCIEEIPSLQRLIKALYDKPFVILGVNLAEGELRVKGAVQRFGIAFPVLLDRDGEAFNRWGATLLPTAYVVDTEGLVRFIGRGPVDWDSDAVMGALKTLLP